MDRDHRTVEQEYEHLKSRLAESGMDVDLDEAKERLKRQRLETPSWGYGDSGTRFYVFKKPGAARNVYEKLQDAAEVHRLTGVTPTVALHIPWDKVDDYTALKRYAEDLGVKIGAINPNLFQDDDYMLGSITHPDPGVRKKAVAHMLECVDIMRTVGSKTLSIWLADGTNYPGQGDFRDRKRWMTECLEEVYQSLDEDMKMLLEYKFFEPGFYHTDLADWGMATITAMKLGPKAKTLVDLGHHPLGTNIQHIVAFLIDEGRLGGFHFNSKKYADDDLTAGSNDPYELFLIFNELARAENEAGGRLDVDYMIDQSHNVKPKIPAMIQTVMNLQRAYAKALLVDRKALARAQQEGDIIGAERVLVDAFNLDVEPLLRMVRAELGVPLDPLKAFAESGYLERVIKERSR